MNGEATISQGDAHGSMSDYVLRFEELKGKLESRIPTHLKAVRAISKRCTASGPIISALHQITGLLEDDLEDLRDKRCGILRDQTHSC